MKGGRCQIEWILGGRFLPMRTQVDALAAPDSTCVIAVDSDGGGYTQHYFDERGVVRLYAMTLDAGNWTLTREAPDFSPLGDAAAHARVPAPQVAHHAQAARLGRRIFSNPPELLVDVSYNSLELLRIELPAGNGTGEPRAVEIRGDQGRSVGMGTFAERQGPQ